MRPSRWIALLCLLVAGPAAPGAAQEAVTSEARGEVAWYQVLRIRFKPGKKVEGLRTAYEHFVPADVAIERPIVNFDLTTGDWHHIVFFPLKGGPADVEWLVSPREAEWWTAFAKLEGGIEPARRTMERFDALVEAYRWDLAYRRLPSSGNAK